MNSYVLAQRNRGELINCAGPLTDTDIPTLFENNPSYKDDFELIDEIIFKITYPSEYKDLIDADVSSSLSVWIETLYNGKHEVALEDNVIGTDNYFLIIQPEDGEICMHLLIGCHPAEALEIGALIREKLPEYRLIVHQAMIFSKIIEN